MSAPNSRPSDLVTQSQQSVLSCVHAVGAALAQPAPGRERAWAGGVLESVIALRQRMEQHLVDVDHADGLYPQIEETFPEATHRVQYLRETNRSLMDRIGLLEKEVGRIAHGEGTAFMAVRSNALQLMGEIRHQQSREIDLVFQAFQTDIGAGD